MQMPPALFRLPMRRFLLWFLPLLTVLVAASLFGYGFLTYVRGDAGTLLGAGSSAPGKAAPVRTAGAAAKLTPLLLGDSLAHGAGDETGLGIGGHLDEELDQRKVPAEKTVNLAVDGARTPGLIDLLTHRNVQEVVARAQPVIVSIGGNDLFGAADWRSGIPSDPEAIMTRVLDNVASIVGTIRASNPKGRIFLIGLYNPFSDTSYGRALNPYVSRWNGRLRERFANDRNLTVVETEDLFSHHDRLSVDRFHPSKEGYTLIARRIAEAL
jgi:lysophospholipase L1-like esterase